MREGSLDAVEAGSAFGGAPWARACGGWPHRNGSARRSVTRRKLPTPEQPGGGTGSAKEASDPPLENHGHTMPHLASMARAVAHGTAAIALGLGATAARAQPCPDKNLMYWQAFPPGGESDISARHQALVLKKKCPAVDTVIQYKAGAGGALLWSQMNTLPGDGYNVGGVNLPHMVLQPIPGGGAADGAGQVAAARDAAPH